MNNFELDWIRMSQSFVQNGWIQDGRIQDGCHHPVSQIELVWVGIRVEGECFWVNLREDDKVSESKMAVSEPNMTEFKMAAIIKFSQNEWVWVRLNWFESEFFCEMAESKMAEFNMEEFKMVAFIKFSQIELVWVRVRVETECFWVNLREDNKVSQSKIAVFESNITEFKMAAMIKLHENEWVWVRLN